MENLFQFLSFSPGIFWFLIIFYPHRRNPMIAVDCFLVFLSAVYVALTLPQVPMLLPIIAEPTLSGIQGVLSSSEGTVATWNHMILSDLWIGRWVAQDSLGGSYSLIVRSFIIPIILFFGPMGLFFYLIFRFTVRRQFALTGHAAEA